MTFSMKRMVAIFQKDLKDLSKNMFVGTAFILPFMMAFLYRNMDTNSIEEHYLVINLAFVSIAFFVQCALIAEEKEMNTLRGLMLSPATIPEILGGKSLVSFILTIVTIIICTKFTGYQPNHLVLISVALLLSLIFYLAVGTMLGLLAKTVVEASIIMMPVVFVFGFSSFIPMLADKYPVLSFAEYLPSVQLVEFAKDIQAGSGLVDTWHYLLIILGWLVLAVFLTIAVYRKKELDD
ncbi:MAG TPA: ABC transporter permease [Tetragenococcus sp.]|nr:ABC transporter permease [Tetragenococcus sp.]